MPHQLKLFDAHCHLDFPEFKGKVNPLIDKCFEVGIQGMLIPGVIRSGWRRIRQLAARNKILHSALGLHPMFMHRHKVTDLHDLEIALALGTDKAVGEIGLDFYKSDTNRDDQNYLFEAQLAIATIAKLPVILHVRKAHEEVLLMLKRVKFQQGGFVHAFSGSEVQAQRYIDMGFKLGFGGAMTYLRALKLHRLASSLPLQSIVLETDAPDMPPSSCTAAHNTPLHLLDNFRFLVTLRNESALEIATQTSNNVREMLKIS